MNNTKENFAKPANRVRKDLVGKRFGKLTVLEYTQEKQKWKCKCDCGNLTYQTTGHLNAGSFSYGCMQKQNLTGKRFGKLLVLRKQIIAGEGITSGYANVIAETSAKSPPEN